MLLLAACTGDDGPETLNLFAAASLTDVLAEVAVTYEAEHPGVDVVLNLGGSSALREQILAGAPADVFVPADPAHADATGGDPVPIATNDLQLVVPAGNPGDVDGLDDLADPGLLVGLCAPEVPCGALALEALDAAGVEASVDTEEPDVRSLLTKVAEGELDAGLVYRTDVLAAGDAVRGIDLPPGAAARTTYVAVALTDEGEQLADYLGGPDAEAVLRAHGFGPP